MAEVSFCKGHPCVLASVWVVNMCFCSSLVFLRGIGHGLSNLLSQDRWLGLLNVLHHSYSQT